jgi:imidazolonepropionase-like amidohydrolase
MLVAWLSGRIARGVLVLLGCGAIAPASAQMRPLLLEDVTVVDGTDKPRVPHASILIEDGRIAFVGPAAAAPRPTGVEVRPLPGRTVIPGLIDMHAHVTTYVDAHGGGAPAGYRYDREVSEAVLRTLLAFGITAVRNPAAPAAEGLRLRDDAAAGRIAGPRIFTAGEALDRGRPQQGPFVTVETEADVRKEVRRQAKLGVDYLKLYTGLPEKLTAAAIAEAHARGVAVIGHLGATSWKDAAELGIDGICHGASWEARALPAQRRAAYERSAQPYLLKRVEWLAQVDLDGDGLRAIVAALVKHGVVVDPTLIAYETKFRARDPFFVDSSDLAFVPRPLLQLWKAERPLTQDWSAEDDARARSAWRKMLALVKLYHDRGVRLVAGSDEPNPWVVPGASLHRELELLVSAGIPAQQVLQMATRNAAEALGISAQAGTVETGKIADLVVLSADPLQDIANTRAIELVLQRGHPIGVPAKRDR